jgi:UDP-2-acetamido-3-amino-2,3-dideoxy-glucuronate N-acetyltransferase
MTIHPLADVQSNKIGEGTRVWQFAIILEGAIIGKDCNINCHTFIENDVIIGNHCTIKSGVYVWDGIQMEDDVFVGPNVTFINNNTPRSQQYPEKHIGVSIRKGVSIGAASTIKGDIEIGDFAMIGAGSLLTKSVPAFQLWYGHPASHKGYVTRDGILLDLNLKDNKGNQFQLINQEPKAK